MDESGKKVTFTWNPIKLIKDYRESGDPFLHFNPPFDFFFNKVLVKHSYVLTAEYIPKEFDEYAGYFLDFHIAILRIIENDPELKLREKSVIAITVGIISTAASTQILVIFDPNYDLCSFCSFYAVLSYTDPLKHCK